MKFFPRLSKFYFQQQFDAIDCGPSSLRMICKYYGKDFSLEYLREQCYLNREGVSILNLSEAAERLGFRTFLAHLNLQILTRDAPLPCIVHWNQDHYVVVHKISNSLFSRQKRFTIADPAHGIITIDEDTFVEAWISSTRATGVALFVEPTPLFYETNNVNQQERGLSFLFKYLLPYKLLFFQLAVGMIVGTFIALSFPYLTRILFDYGVMAGNRSIVFWILISQLFLFSGSFATEIVRSWLLLHVNSRVSLNIISDFLIKLLKLPIKFFDTKTVGDLTQRINDHHRIENFLTSSLLSTVFSLFNIVVFSLILAYYNIVIFSVFCIFSLLGIFWIFLFRKRRKKLDYKRFLRNKENQDKLYEMITGMQEIKLYGSETSKRWQWERLQVKYFRLNIKSLIVEQYQQYGFFFFSQIKNILISFLAANEAINGSISFGTLLSISYIVGQTNGPIEQLVSFIKISQDAKLSLDRMQEIHSKDDEDNYTSTVQSHNINCNSDIKIDNVSFQYEGPNSPSVLKNLTFKIPHGKVTAIVGTSGSGKTTLLKLLLGFYQPAQGKILVGATDLCHISPKLWRLQCGTVMQDGYIFNDTISRNIALDGSEIDKDRMEHAVSTACLSDFIQNLPLGYTTKIGSSGIGLSGGQKQRVLIARAAYKNPSFLFLDEATSSLDANNEKRIIENLTEFFVGRTVLVIAHRLSTVRNADQIVVLEDGQVCEIGNHEVLSKKKGKYYELVKNQLELGN